MLNYERILNVEIGKTSDLISQLIPQHIIHAIKNENRHIDQFEDLTLLYTSMVGFTDFNTITPDSKLIVNLLQKLFIRFDQLCTANKVYKVHTWNDSYVLMGYDGRVDKMRRSRGVVVNEINKIIQTGLEMMEIVKEFRDQVDNKKLKNLEEELERY